MELHCVNLLKELNLDVDLLLVGDGSGTVYNKPFGWACVCFEPEERKLHLEKGGGTSGTNNLAELTPYVHCLWKYQQRLEKAKNYLCKRIAIVSDSEWVVKCGRGEYTKSALLHLWCSLGYFGKRFSINWFHKPRMSNEMLQWADREAGKIRKIFFGA